MFHTYRNNQVTGISRRIRETKSCLRRNVVVPKIRVAKAITAVASTRTRRSEGFCKNLGNDKEDIDNNNDCSQTISGQSKNLKKKTKQ